eukprot:scaffold109876_cov55-Attheya_sp.AAC.1
MGKDGILTNTRINNDNHTSSSTSTSLSPPPSLASSGSGDKSSSGLPARDVVLAKGVMRPLLKCLETHCLNLSLQRIGAWVLSNLVEGQFQQPPSSSSNNNNNNGGDNGKSSSSSSSNNNNNNNNTKGSGENSNNTSANASDEIIDMHTLLPTLRRLLSMADAEVLSYTCWTLSHLCDGPSSHIAAVVTTPSTSTTTDPNQPSSSSSSSPPGGLVPRLVELLLHPSWRVTKPALRTIGNIVCAECGDEQQQGGTTTNHTVSSGSIGSSSSGMITDYTEVILDCGAVPRLTRLITHSNREIQKEACWTLSNIAAGTVNQIEAVIRSNAIPPLVELVKDKSTDHEVRSEACWVVLNATSCGSDQQIETLVDEGCVSVLGVLLGEASMVMMALEGLERVLQVEETREVVRKTKIAAARVLERGIDLDDPEFARSIMVRDEFEQQQQQNQQQRGERPPPLVSPSLIEKALEKHNNSAVTKRAGRIWKQHFVSCALCRQSFSRHRAGDAHFCEECKCHVCQTCDCQVYHLSYQEELWAESEEKKEATKRAKKSKKQKKKEKQKEKKAKQQQQQPPPVPPKQLPTTNTSQTTSSKKATNNNNNITRSRSSTVTSSAESLNRVPSPSLDDLSAVSSGSDPKDAKVSTSVEESKRSNQDDSNRSKTARKKKGKSSQGDGDKTEERVDDEIHNTNTKEVHSEGEDQQPPIDFVLYLQQTGSIIALAKLMDALEYGNDGNDYDEEIDAELQMLSQQQHLLNRQAI